MAALQSDPGSHITPGHPQPLVTDSREPGEGFVSGAQILLFFPRHAPSLFGPVWTF